MVCLSLFRHNHKESALPQTMAEMIGNVIDRQTVIDADLKQLAAIALDSARRDDASGYLWSALDDARTESAGILRDLIKAQKEARGRGQ